MLSLHSATSEEWLRQVTGAGLTELLIDHAHCEKKAAGTAMGLLVAYVEDRDLGRAMTEIIQEELSHYHLVLDLLERRNIRFRRIRPSRYGAALHTLVSRNEPQRAVDRLLIAGLIEARSCERFGLLRDRLADRELAEFFSSLFESEARHHSTYVRLAHAYASAEQVRQRLHDLAEAEAAILATPDDVPRMHS